MPGLDPSLSTEGLSLYKELGIEKKATASEVKRAYHKKALRCHPDKVGNDDLQAAEQFKKINRANKILKDEQTRKIYDKMGSQGLAMMEQMGENGPDVMEKFMHYDKWYYKLCCLLLFCGTGCCFVCGCCFCCGCCCCFGKCAPEVPKEDDEQELHQSSGSDTEPPVISQPKSTDDNNKNTTSQPVFAMPAPESSNQVPIVIAMPPTETAKDTENQASPPPYLESQVN